MVDPNTRSGKRTPVTLKIKFKSETLEQFIERYAVDVSQGGIFIRTKEPLAVGTQMKFEFQLRDASPLISGEGTVVWTRENDPSRPAIAPGMGVRFDRLSDGSQTVLERILSEKAKQAPQRGQTESPTKPPLFTDQPTRVAPAPIQEGLGVTSSRTTTGRKRADSEQTPLPKPMPFHSDAEDFDEQAFDEATKVRALDDLVAQTAHPNLGSMADPKTAIMPMDELALRRQQGRADSTLADPPTAVRQVPPVDLEGKTIPDRGDRESAPGLPNPPEPGRAGRLLDTTPSPPATLPDEGPTRPSRPSSPPKEELAGRTRLGLEPAKVAVGKQVESTEKMSVPRAVAAAEASRPSAPKRPSSVPIVIAIFVIVAGVAFGAWFFFLRDFLNDRNTADDTGSVAKKTPVVKPTTGSAQQAVAQQGSATTGSGTTASAQQGSASVVEAPKPKLVDTVIDASVAKAKIDIDGDSQTGAAPFTAKLEKDKHYKVHVQAPGFAVSELEVVGGTNAKASLVAKPRIVTVSSEPPGAQIAIDGTPTGKSTPADITLSAAQAAKARTRVTLRRAGYRAFEQGVDKWTEAESQMTATVTAKLAIAPKVVVPPSTGTGSATPTGAGSGSGEPASGSGETKPPEDKKPPEEPKKPPEEPKKPEGGGSNEPEPDFVHRQ